MWTYNEFYTKQAQNDNKKARMENKEDDKRA